MAMSIILNTEIGNPRINARCLGVQIGGTAGCSPYFSAHIEVVFSSDQRDIGCCGYAQSTCSKNGGTRSQIAAVSINLQVINQGIGSNRRVKNNVGRPGNLDGSAGRSLYGEFAYRSANPGIGVTATGG